MAVTASASSSPAAMAPTSRVLMLTYRFIRTLMSENSSIINLRRQGQLDKDACLTGGGLAPY